MEPAYHSGPCWRRWRKVTEGDGPEELLKDFPTLTANDIRTVIPFASASAEGNPPATAAPFLDD